MNPANSNNGADNNVEDGSHPRHHQPAGEVVSAARLLRRRRRHHLPLPQPIPPREIPFLFPTFADIPGLLLTSDVRHAFQTQQGSTLRHHLPPQQPDLPMLLPPVEENISRPPSTDLLVGEFDAGSVDVAHDVVDETWNRFVESTDSESTSLGVLMNPLKATPSDLEIQVQGELTSIAQSEISEKQEIARELDKFFLSHQAWTKDDDDVDDLLLDEAAAVARGRGICFALVLIFFIILGNLAAGLYLILFKGDNIEHPYACPTKHCVRMAQWIKGAIDQTEDPCDDFYNFACGKYMKKNPPTLSKNEPVFLYSYGIPVNFRENEKIGNFLKRVHTFPANQLLPYYQACIDTRRRNNVGVKPLVNLLGQVRALDPQSGTSSFQSVFNIARVMGRVFRKTNKLFFLDLDEVADNMMLFKLAQAPPEVLETPSDVYANTMRQAFKLLETDLLIDGDEEIDTIVYVVMEFEAQLAIILTKGMQPSVFGFPSNFHIKKPEKFHSNFARLRGRFDWDEVVASIMGYRPAQYKDFRVSFNFWSSIYSKHDRFYILLLQDLLRDTPAYTISRYFQWELMKIFAFELNEEVQNIMLPIYRTAGHTVIQRCFRSLFSDLHLLAAYHYKMQMHDPDSIDRDMTAIAEKIFETFTEAIVEKDLPEAFKASLLATGRTLRVVMQPVQVLAPYLGVFYDKYNCSKDHFMNVIRARSIKARNVVFKYERKPPFHLWIDGIYSLTEVTETSLADHWSTMRFMHVPFGAMQVPFMGNDLPILNYAGYGHYMVAYHLVTRALHDLFRVNEANSRIYEPRDKVLLAREFQRSVMAIAECVVHSQSNLRFRSYPDIAMNSTIASTREKMIINTFSLELTLLVIEKLFKASENVTRGDSPMHEILTANEKVTERFPQYQVLPGLEKYSPRQLVFLSIARQNCQAHPRARVEYRMKHGPLLREVGIKGMFRNSKQFSEVWNCPAGSFMNPRKKCTLFTGRKLEKPEGEEHLHSDKNENGKIAVGDETQEEHKDNHDYFN